MEDKYGSERMVLESPAANSWIRVGSPNDPIALNGQAVVLRDADVGYRDEGVSGAGQSNATLVVTDASGTPVTGDFFEQTKTAGIYTYTYTSLPSEAGKSTDTAIRKVYVGTGEIDNINRSVEDSSGIRIRTAGAYWNEGMSRVGDYIGGPAPSYDNSPKRVITSSDSTADTDPTHTNPNQVGNLLQNFGVGASYNPSGLLSYYKDLISKEPNILTMAQAMENAHVTVSSMDSFNTQEGNIYDFGGYWNYNLGNSYAEEFIEQAPSTIRLNEVAPYYWPKDTAPDPDAKWSITDTKAGEGVSIGATVAAAIAIPIAATAAAASSVGGAIGFGIAGAAAATAVGAILGLQGGLDATDTNIQDNIGNVVEKPNQGPIKTWAFGKNIGVGSSFIGADAEGKVPGGEKKQDRDPSKDSGGPMRTDTTWVTKQYGDSYGFVRGNDIDIRIGNTESHHHGNSNEIVYGGVHTETKYNGEGNKVAYERGGGGTRTEINWHHSTGNLVSYEYYHHGWFSYAASFVTVPTLAITTSVSTLQAKVDISAGALDINASLSAGIKTNIEASCGLTFEFEYAVGGKIVYDENTKGLQYRGTGSKFETEALLKGTIHNLVMEDYKTELTNRGITLDSKKIEVETATLKASSGFHFQS
jgi:hypothetical protein